MKSLLLLFVLWLTITPFASAQDSTEAIFSFGLKAGASDYSFSTDDVSASSDFSYYLGGYANHNISNTSSFQIEFLFQDYTIEDETFLNTETDLLQLSLPVFMKFEAKPNLFLNLGGYVGHNININSELNGRSIGDLIKTWDAGLLAGIEYHVYKGLFVEVRYNYGLTDLQNGPESTGDVLRDLDEIKIRSLFFGLGFKF
jgi:opacity protein-like surface antigen